MGKNSLIKSTTKKKKAQKKDKPAGTTVSTAEIGAMAKVAEEKNTSAVYEAATAAEMTQTPPYEKPFEMKGSDPMEKGIKLFIAVVVLLIATLIGVSYMNTSSYYLESISENTCFPYQFCHFH